jgi:hypothetical protein
MVQRMVLSRQLRLLLHKLLPRVQQLKPQQLKLQPLKPQQLKLQPLKLQQLKPQPLKPQQLKPQPLKLQQQQALQRTMATARALLLL